MDHTVYRLFPSPAGPRARDRRAPRPAARPHPRSPLPPQRGRPRRTSLPPQMRCPLHQMRTRGTAREGPHQTMRSPKGVEPRSVDAKSVDAKLKAPPHQMRKKGTAREGPHPMRTPRNAEPVDRPHLMRSRCVDVNSVDIRLQIHTYRRVRLKGPGWVGPTPSPPAQHKRRAGSSRVVVAVKAGRVAVAPSSWGGDQQNRRLRDYSGPVLEDPADPIDPDRAARSLPRGAMLWRGVGRSGAERDREASPWPGAARGREVYARLG